MRIGSLARTTGVSPRSLRYYEQQGLLTADRTAGGQREYPADAAERVDLITSLLAAGLSTSSIYDVLPCITEASIRTPALAARLGAELDRVDAQITALTTTRQILAELVARYAESHQVGSDGAV